jgi:hypothetical protein
MIKKWKLFLESNKTTKEDEDSLQKYFDLTSDEVKEWLQEFLDDTMLDFDISVINHKLFMITFYQDDLKGITKEKYPFPEKLLQYLMDRFAEYNCKIIPEPGSKESGMPGYVYYAISKKYMSIRVEKVE